MGLAGLCQVGAGYRRVGRSHRRHSAQLAVQSPRTRKLACTRALQTSLCTGAPQKTDECCSHCWRIARTAEQPTFVHRIPVLSAEGAFPVYRIIDGVAYCAGELPHRPGTDVASRVLSHRPPPGRRPPGPGPPSTLRVAPEAICCWKLLKFANGSPPCSRSALAAGRTSVAARRPVVEARPASQNMTFILCAGPVAHASALVGLLGCLCALDRACYLNSAPATARHPAQGPAPLRELAARRPPASLRCDDCEGCEGCGAVQLVRALPDERLANAPECSRKAADGPQTTHLALRFSPPQPGRSIQDPALTLTG
jgi:hypothetical protein